MLQHCGYFCGLGLYVRGLKFHGRGLKFHGLVAFLTAVGIRTN